MDVHVYDIDVCGRTGPVRTYVDVRKDGTSWTCVRHGRKDGRTRTDVDVRDDEDAIRPRTTYGAAVDVHDVCGPT